MDEITLTLNSPITEEQWDMIEDVDFDHTSEITFHTKHGKVVKFVKSSELPEPHYDEWCTNCKEYDHERHCCPRFNRVIREALKDAHPEIVYCKDCICGHGEVWLSGNGSADFYGYCGQTQLRVLPYDYCSYAKKRVNTE